MYEDYWQLERKPFESVAEQRDYYPSEAHQGALLKLRYVVENRRGAGLLAGPSGCGKTMLVETLRRQLPEDFQPFAHLVFPQMSAAELLCYVAEELGAPVGDEPGKGIHQTVRRIDHFLQENTRSGKHAVVVIDEAQLLVDTGVLDTLRLLLNFELAARPGMTLLVVGEPALLPALQRMPALEERMGVKTLLRPFNLEESISYVNHRLTAAGATRAIFDPAALEAAHHLAHGIPRQLNRLCDLALLIGFAEGLPSIGPAHMESVCDELVAVAPE